jgi:hypothetical protein
LEGRFGFFFHKEFFTPCVWERCRVVGREESSMMEHGILFCFGHGIFILKHEAH